MRTLFSVSVLAVGMRVAVAAQYAAANGVCNEQAGDALCSGAACQRRFDVLAPVTDAECRSICDVLNRTCTGYEAQNGFQDRCELWKVPIGAVNAGAAWYEVCNNKTAVGDSDGELYLHFTLKLYALNGTAVLEKTSSEQAQFAALIKSTVANVYTTAGNVTLSASDIKLNFSNASQNVVTNPLYFTFGTTVTTMELAIINPQPDKWLPIRMYRLLFVSDTDAQDGLTRIANSLMVSMNTNSTLGAFAAAGVLEANRTVVLAFGGNPFFLTDPPADAFLEDTSTTTTTTTTMEGTTTMEDPTTPGTGNAMSTTMTEAEEEQALNATNTTVTMDVTTTPNQQTTSTMTMTGTLLTVSGAHPTCAALAAKFYIKVLVSLAGVWAGTVLK